MQQLLPKYQIMLGEELDGLSQPAGYDVAGVGQENGALSLSAILV
jgi:hypothetical protein